VSVAQAPGLGFQSVSGRVPVTPFAKPSGTKPEEKKAHMAIRIKDVNTREDVRLAIQKAVRQQVQTFDALRDIEHELGFDPANLDSVVSTAASDADSEYELTQEDYRYMLRELERE